MYEILLRLLKAHTLDYMYESSPEVKHLYNVLASEERKNIDVHYDTACWFRVGLVLSLYPLKGYYTVCN